MHNTAKDLLPVLPALLALQRLDDICLLIELCNLKGGLAIGIECTLVSTTASTCNKGYVKCPDADSWM
jgi:hypothetical protein